MNHRPGALSNARIEPFLPPEAELQERFLRAGGPGGQHVNRTETAVQLRFDCRASAWLNAETCERLLKIAGRRADRHGVITIEASEFRSQLRNRLAARERLAELIEQAQQKPKPRRATTPSKAQRKARMEQKKRRSQALKLRRRPNPGDD